MEINKRKKNPQQELDVFLFQLDKNHSKESEEWTNKMEVYHTAPTTSHEKAREGKRLDRIENI